MKTLVADDDPTLRLLIASVVRGLGHEVVECASGNEAWDRFRSGAFPIVITDWMMPGLDGIQLTQHIRRAPSEAYTYVIMLTSKVKREDYLEGLNAGADAFLMKPLDTAMLEAQILIAARILGLEAHAKKLEALMTVCSHCKRVRDKGEWIPLAEYVETHFKVRPSHGYCPTCFEEKVEPELKALGIPTEGMKHL
jgi:phosphoserine phosphatase RsbU/P